MARYVNISEYLPQVLKELEEIKALNLVENPILIQEWMFAENQLNNQFVETANETGIQRYERMLKLNYSDSDTLETRRFRIISRFQEQAPYTWRVLHKILTSLLGEGGYRLERNVATKTLNVKIDLTVSSQFNILVDTLERIVPANMIINVELLYNSHQDLSAFTHAELSAYTHQQLREGVL